MTLTFLLLAVLFLAGLINYFFYFPSHKLHAWLRSSLQQKPSLASSVGPHMERSAPNKSDLRRVFATFDKNGDGFITKQELRESLNNIGMVMTEKEVREMIEKLDGNGDGLIDIEEFCELYQVLVGGDGRRDDEREDDGGDVDLKEAFDVFDGNGDGLITVEELGMVLSSLGLNQGRKMEDCKEMIKKVDMDGDGMVNFAEFKKMMRSGGRFVSAF